MRTPLTVESIFAANGNGERSAGKRQLPKIPSRVHGSDYNLLEWSPSSWDWRSVVCSAVAQVCPEQAGRRRLRRRSSPVGCLHSEGTSQDVPIEYFDDYSWRAFIAMVWPAAPGSAASADAAKRSGTRVRACSRRYKSLWEVFHENGTPPRASFDELRLARRTTRAARRRAFGDLIIASASGIDDIGQAGTGRVDRAARRAERPLRALHDAVQSGRVRTTSSATSYYLRERICRRFRARARRCRSCSSRTGRSRSRQRGST